LEEPLTAPALHEDLHTIEPLQPRKGKRRTNLMIAPATVGSQEDEEEIQPRRIAKKMKGLLVVSTASEDMVSLDVEDAGSQLKKKDKKKNRQEVIATAIEGMQNEETKSKKKREIRNVKKQEVKTTTLDEMETLDVEETQVQKKRKKKKGKEGIETTIPEQEDVTQATTPKHSEKKGKNKVTLELAPEAIEPAPSRRERKVRGAEPVFVAGAVVGLRRESRVDAKEDADEEETVEQTRVQPRRRKNKKKKDVAKTKLEGTSNDDLGEMPSDSDEPAKEPGINRRTSNLRILESSSEDEEEGRKKIKGEKYGGHSVEKEKYGVRCV